MLADPSGRDPECIGRGKAALEVNRFPCLSRRWLPAQARCYEVKFCKDVCLAIVPFLCVICQEVCALVAQAPILRVLPSQRALRGEARSGGPPPTAPGCTSLLCLLHCTPQRPGGSYCQDLSWPHPCCQCDTRVSPELAVPPGSTPDITSVYILMSTWYTPALRSLCMLTLRSLTASQECICQLQILPCMHMDVCFECVQKHEQQQRLRSPSGSITCPMCRAPIRSTMPLPVQSLDIY